MQLGFYFDQSRCVGCYTCVVACKDWHDTVAGPANWISVITIERGKFPNPFLAYLPVSCYHCANPLCAQACPADAITKREEDGIVVVDSEKCRGSDHCGEARMIGIPREERESPCKIMCPAHVGIQGYMALVAKGYFKEAFDLIRRDMPLPGVSGRMCSHPCEAACKRESVDAPLDIAAAKRFVSDYASGDAPAAVPRTKNERVAIIGSGPAGLAAAYDLVRKGYGITVFEALPVAGGMLAVGIPEYRLPKEVLEQEIEYIKRLGVEIKTNVAFGQGLNLNDLFGQGYGAILLAIGAQQGQRLNIPGAELEGTLVGTSFLRDFNLGKKVEVGNRVLVLGGGNVAMDCARTALRLGASEVHVACLECREDMPAEGSQIEQAEEEGITIHPSLTFTRIWGEGARATGVECLKLRGVEFDEDRQPHVHVIEGTEHVLPVDTVIFAVGQTLDLLMLPKELSVTRQHTIVVDPVTLATNLPGVFAAGDAISGPATFIEAIAAGREAAISIERYFNGEDLKRGRLAKKVEAADIKIEISPEVEKGERQKMPVLPVVERIHNFREVSQGFTKEKAIAEAKRCMKCAGMVCKEVCPYAAPQFGAGNNVKIEKCDFCVDRLAENKQPICVEACPMRALDAGPLDELKARYRDIREAEGFVYAEDVMPSIVFKAK